tara:strand:+ start:25 stop:564 length:540 start_codon:yes stop_codon:yes gene_type:complete
MLSSWIEYYDNIVPDDLCKEIMKYPWTWKNSTYSSNEGVNSDSQNRVLMDEVWVEDLNRPYPRLKESVLKIMKLYGEKHKNFSCVHHTDFRINRYGVDGFMSLHSDNIHHSHGQRYGYPQATVIFFINNEYEGGEFIVENNSYKTKSGSGIIFPSNFMFPHEVKPITKGERWSIVSWLM